MCIYMYIYNIYIYRCALWAMPAVALGGWGCPGLADTRYCHDQYCMVYGIKRGGR